MILCFAWTAGESRRKCGSGRKAGHSFPHFLITTCFLLLLEKCLKCKMESANKFLGFHELRLLYCLWLTGTAFFSLMAGSFAVSQDFLPASGGLYRLFSFKCPENKLLVILNEYDYASPKTYYYQNTSTRCPKSNVANVRAFSSAENFQIAKSFFGMWWYLNSFEEYVKCKKIHVHFFKCKFLFRN